MKHEAPERKETGALSPPAIIQAFRELYIFSGAAAQLGGHGLEILDSQWDALIRCTREARALAGEERTSETEAVAALCDLLALCEHIVELRVSGLACPPAVWRKLARVGREAYRSIDPHALASGPGDI
jgi:hypothetical protein